MATLDLQTIRTEILAAVASDPTLRAALVLKGGNALALVHKIGMRSSLDFDYSIPDDLKRPDAFADALRQALQKRFERHQVAVIDFRFGPRPRTKRTTWGGYNAEFKLVSVAAGDADVDLNRKQALSTDGGGQGKRTFRIEISKFEFCHDLVEAPIGGDAVCRVYSLDLIAAEKIRSLCQQMPNYTLNRTKTPRARDFFDLHAVITEAGVDLAHPDLQALVRASFEQKSVPLRSISQIETHTEFHERGWEQVLNAIPAHKPRDFAYYSSFVVAETRKLKPLWDLHAP